MKSCLGLLLALTLFVAVIGGGGLIYYLSRTSEFTRTGDNRENPAPLAIPMPQTKPPVAIPVR